MDQVIEISSSPEPLAGNSGDPHATVRRARHPKQRSRARTPLVNRDVIELTDSEDEMPAKKGSRSTNGRIATKGTPRESEAGPSHPTNQPSGSRRADVTVDQPAQVSSPATAFAGGSVPTGSLQKPIAVPLFLPDGEEHDLPQAVSPRAGPYPATIVVDEIPEELPQPIHDDVLPPPDVDPMDAYVARVLEIIPDVQPAHVVSLLEQLVQTHQDDVVEVVLHNLFEDPTYPKIDRKGKRKAEDDTDERPTSKMKIDYGDKLRVMQAGPLYVEIAMEQLLLDFPYIPKPHVRKAFFANNALYAPTYLFLAEEKKKNTLPYNVKTIASRVTGKGKAKQDPEFDKEREWLLLRLEGDVATVKDAQVVEETDEQEDCGDGIECGCCFSTYPFDKMVQCPDCHLFCSSCMTSYASNLLGSHDPAIICMDQSGCKLVFPESELRRFLTPKLFTLYLRVKQRKEIEAAGLENLEECPCCEYKVVIENDEEKLFRCENVDCGAVSCRECKKPDHLPKSCKEVEEDKNLDARHAIEEAMSRALMRNCPKCQKAFVKEYGCNKMTCPNCGTLSCYVCRAVITGYEHFDQTPPHSGMSDPKTKKCSLWHPVEQQHTEEVSKAANEALEEYKRLHPDINQEELKAVQVDLPRAPPAPAPVAGLPNFYPMPGPAGMANAFAQAQIMAGGHQHQPIPAFYNFNIGYGMPQAPLRVAAPAARPAPAPVVARPRRGRARRA